MSGLDDRRWLRSQYQTHRRPVGEIAAECGVDPSTVWRALRRHGIELRGPAGRRHVTDDQIHGALAEAPSIRDAARCLGLHPDSLYDRARRAGLLPTWPVGPDDIADRYQAGASVAALADAEGVSPRTVRRWLRSRGATMRPAGRPYSS